MKWGRKKNLPFSSSSSIANCSQTSSLVSHMFPISWFSKLKHNNSPNSEPNKLNPNPTYGKSNSPFLSSPLDTSNNGYDNGKFYGFHDEEGSFWRLSFGQDNADDNSKRVGLKSSVCVEFDGPVSLCPSCRKKQYVLREIGDGENISSCDNDGYVIALSPGLRTIKERREDLDLENTKEEIKHDTMSLASSPSLKQLRQRKSVYLSMEKQRKRRMNNKSHNNRVGAYSPRAETCKVKALEDIKKTKLKKNKKRKDGKRGLESFAVVKSSSDPEKDFKESMVEMILEKKMSRPEELEELLACYLTLNSDEHHDLIIKVFREVWLGLDHLGSEASIS